MFMVYPSCVLFQALEYYDEHAKAAQSIQDTVTENQVYLRQIDDIIQTYSYHQKGQHSHCKPSPDDEARIQGTRSFKSGN